MPQPADPNPPSHVVQMLQRLQQRARAGGAPPGDGDGAAADRHPADHATDPDGARTDPDDVD